MARPWNQEAAARRAARGKIRMAGELMGKRLAKRGGGKVVVFVFPGIQKDKEVVFSGIQATQAAPIPWSSNSRQGLSSHDHALM
jgi:hypothetical protein